MDVLFSCNINCYRILLCEYNEYLFQDIFIPLLIVYTATKNQMFFKRRSQETKIYFPPNIQSSSHWFSVLFTLFPPSSVMCTRRLCSPSSKSSVHKSHLFFNDIRSLSAYSSSGLTGKFQNLVPFLLLFKLFQDFYNLSQVLCNKLVSSKIYYLL